MAKLKFKREVRLALSTVFILIELAFAFAIQLVPYSRFGLHAYISIVLVFLSSFLVALNRNNPLWLVRLGLFFTLGADFALVVLVPERKMAGVLIFIIVQLLYAAYLLLEARTRVEKNAGIILRSVLSIAALTAPFVVLGEKVDALSVISVFYYAQLVSNLTLAVIQKKPLFAVALLLFALCDLAIGLEQMVKMYLGASAGTFLYWVAHSDLNIPWIFYLPSQVLISLSVIFNNKSRPTRE